MEAEEIPLPDRLDTIEKEMERALADDDTLHKMMAKIATFLQAINRKRRKLLDSKESVRREAQPRQRLITQFFTSV